MLLAAFMETAHGGHRRDRELAFYATSPVKNHLRNDGTVQCDLIVIEKCRVSPDGPSESTVDTNGRQGICMYDDQTAYTRH